MSVNPVSLVFWDEKDRLIRPLGRARGDGPGCGECGVPVLVSLDCRLSPLFYEDVQIYIFPAPISCLGERRLAAADGDLRVGRSWNVFAIAVTYG
jgi:hypothetical protein